MTYEKIIRMNKNDIIEAHKSYLGSKGITPGFIRLTCEVDENGKQFFGAFVWEDNRK